MGVFLRETDPEEYRAADWRQALPRPEIPAGWTPEDESAFQAWYRHMAQHQGLSENPDDPLHLYEYRKAWKAGNRPDEGGHMPSDFKLPGHPTFYKAFGHGGDR